MTDRKNVSKLRIVKLVVLSFLGFFVACYLSANMCGFFQSHHAEATYIGDDDRVHYTGMDEETYNEHYTAVDYNGDGSVFDGIKKAFDKIDFSSLIDGINEIANKK